MQLNPYLTFDGECRAAFEFYAQVLGAEIGMMMTHGESPMADQTPAEWRDRIMHAQLSLGDAVLMGSDQPPQYREEPKGFSVSLGIDDPRQAERIFDALAKDGTVRMPLQETFWALRFGMLVDRFGIPWMINCGRPA
jgi:PhnB protein